MSESRFYAAMLVLLGLFPIVMLEMKYLSHIFRQRDQRGADELS